LLRILEWLIMNRIILWVTFLVNLIQKIFLAVLDQSHFIVYQRIFKKYKLTVSFFLTGASHVYMPWLGLHIRVCPFSIRRRIESHAGQLFLQLVIRFFATTGRHFYGADLALTSHKFEIRTFFDIFDIFLIAVYDYRQVPDLILRAPQHLPVVLLVEFFVQLIRDHKRVLGLRVPSFALIPIGQIEMRFC
jgi:hypothetical protein